MSTLQRLADRGLIKPPKWLPGNVQYETIMGSSAYGVSSDTSDVDVYGWAVPRKETSSRTFAGRSWGSASRPGGSSSTRSTTSRIGTHWADNGRNYDLTIFGVVKFFALAMENNPNIIDSVRRVTA